MKKRVRIAAVVLFSVAVLLLVPEAAAAQNEAEGEQLAQEDADAILQGIMDELDFTELDDLTEEHLPQKMTFSALVQQLIENGAAGMDVRTVGAWISDLFFYEIGAARPLFIQMFLFAVLFAVANRFFLNGGTYVGEMGFLVIYGAVMLLLMESFLLVSGVVTEGVDAVSSFLSTLVPAYATTLMLSGNAAAAGVFYELAFGIVCVLEWAMKVLLVPGIHVFVLLVLLDHLFEEEKLSRLAELIESGIGLFLKAGISGVIGISVVQSLLAPAKDRISQNVLLRSMTAIPGVGNGIHFAEEVIFGCGVLVKNSVGAAGMILLFCVCLTPLVKVFSFTLLYRLLAAVLQPVADPRIVECMQGVARGSTLYLKVMAATMLLFVITIAMVTVCTGFVY